MQLSRRTFLISSLAGIAAVPGYSRFLESEWLDVTEKRVPIPGGKLGREIRILHLSDLHASETVPFALIRRAIELGLERAPDIACLTGDYVTDSVPDPKQYAETLRLLGNAVPSFACFGNHDGGWWANGYGGHADTSAVARVLESAGIDCLKNEARVVTARGQLLHIASLGDLWSMEVDPEKTYASVSIPAAASTLLLAHNPDTRLQLGDYPWDLMLSGHTHGGQIVIPVVGYAPFVPIKDRRFTEGLRLWRGRRVHVTRGVGNILGVRLNCRPEVSLLTLTPETAGA